MFTKKRLPLLPESNKKERNIIMARPIKETPILFGEDAERFLKEMKEVKAASSEERQRVRQSYERLKKIATFMM